MTYKNVNDKLNDLGRLLVEIFKAQIRAQNKVASGNLLDSVEYQVEIGGNFSAVKVFAADYFRYIVEGRKAGYPSGGDGSFLRNLIEWVRVRGLESDDKAIRSAAYAIRESIFKNGIPPVDLLAFAQKEIEREVDQQFTEALNKDVQELLDRAILG